jgi:hypothetical protein
MAAVTRSSPSCASGTGDSAPCTRDTSAAVSWVTTAEEGGGDAPVMAPRAGRVQKKSGAVSLLVRDPPWWQLEPGCTPSQPRPLGEAADVCWRSPSITCTTSINANCSRGSTPGSFSFAFALGRSGDALRPPAANGRSMRPI